MAISLYDMSVPTYLQTIGAVSGFLDKGLDPNTADPGGITLLMIASRDGRVDLVNLLLSRKADLLADDRRRLGLPRQGPRAL